MFRRGPWPWQMGKAGGFWDDVVPQVDTERCRRCADCAPVAACLAQGFRREDPGSVPAVDANLCFGCYSCAGSCPHGAIILPRRAR
jgi:TPP-dependent indolepyruvate ferredoxin oxidoreductase alpha subunit